MRLVFLKITTKYRQNTLFSRLALRRAVGGIQRGINRSPDAQEALAAIRDRDGVTVDEAVRAALLSWAGQTERGKT